MNTPIPKTKNVNSPFHSGEQYLQTKSGKQQVMESHGHKAIRSYMPEQHREFFPRLPFMIIGSVDEAGWPWASVLSGRPGFVASPDPTTLTLNAKPLTGDPLGDALKLQAPLGLLGIELSTRRRNRLNARISHIDGSQFTLKVDQSFGNCPQYIHLRSPEFVREPEEPNDADLTSDLKSLDEAARMMIRSADTFFVSSYITAEERPETEGVDVSHRGGKPGFVKVDGDTLTIPDYPGNFYFNTLGNFLLNPKAGLVFPDFETGDVLQLTGSVELIDEDDPVIQAYEGAARGWRFTMHHAKRLTAALPFRSDLNRPTPGELS